MSTAYLFVGPRGVGKTSFAKYLSSVMPEIKVVSRDEITLDLYGATSINPYTMSFNPVYKIMYQKLAEFSCSDVILDCWIGYKRDFFSMIKKMFELNFDKVVVCVFCAELDLIVSQLYARDGRNQSFKSYIQKNIQVFYREVSSFTSDLELDDWDDVHVKYIDSQTYQLTF